MINALDLLNLTTLKPDIIYNLERHIISTMLDIETVQDKAAIVFKSMEAAADWMIKFIPELEGKPYEICETSNGTKELLKYLKKIEQLQKI